MRDREVEVVDGGGDLVGRRPVRTEQGRLPEAERTAGLGLADELRRLAVAAGPLALPDRALFPAEAEPCEVLEDRLGPAGTFRAGSVSSMRRSRAPPCSSAKTLFATALNAPPR